MLKLPSDGFVMKPGDWVRFAKAHPLPRRRMDVLRLLVADEKRETIAKKLGITVGSVQQHIARIHKELGVHDNIGLMNLVFQFWRPARKKK